MRIIVDIGHPAHVHFFKNFIWKMKAKGHEILITASKKEITLDLLAAYGLDYIFTSKRYKGIGLAYELIKRDAQMLELALKFKPDVITGINNTIAAHISKMTKAKSIIFTDTEHAKLANLVTFPFADVICTPSCFKEDLGKKQLRYNGYHELAYLHPNYFKPDPSVLSNLGLNPADTLITMRFVSFNASHDAKTRGFSQNMKERMVSELEKYGKVIITSEGDLPPSLEKYKLRMPPEKLLSILYYSKLYIGDGGTTAVEAALLGTPAIHCAFLRDGNKILSAADIHGNFYEVQHVYKILYSFSNESEALEKAIELLESNNPKERASEKRANLLKDKINVTDFMVWFIENYPASFRELQDNPDTQMRFKK